MKLKLESRVGEQQTLVPLATRLVPVLRFSEVTYRG